MEGLGELGPYVRSRSGSGVWARDGQGLVGTEYLT